MTESHAELVDLLTALGCWRRLDQRTAEATRLFTAGVRASDVEILARSVKGGSDRAAVLVGILSDPAEALRRAQDESKRVSQTKGAELPSGPSPWLVRAHEMEAKIRGWTPEEAAQARLDKLAHDGLHAERKAPGCGHGRSCERRPNHPSCCVPEWLARQGYPGWTEATVAEAAARHDARISDQPNGPPPPTPPRARRRLRRV